MENFSVFRCWSMQRWRMMMKKFCCNKMAVTTLLRRWWIRRRRWRFRIKSQTIVQKVGEFGSITNRVQFSLLTRRLKNRLWTFNGRSGNNKKIQNTFSTMILAILSLKTQIWEREGGRVSVNFSSVHTRVKKSKNVLTGNCHKNATAEKYLLDLTLKNV